MSFFQISAILFAFFMMYVIGIHRRKAALTKIEVSFWYSMWFIFIAIAVFPHWLLGLAGIFNFARVFDLLTVIAFMILSLLIFSTYLSQKDTKHKIEKLIRELAHQERLENDQKRP